MKAVQTNNSDLLKVYTDYSNQLKNNKTVEGQELTEQQKSYFAKSNEYYSGSIITTEPTIC